jgi:hypothetical protein
MEIDQERFAPFHCEDCGILILINEKKMEGKVRNCETGV